MVIRNFVTCMYIAVKMIVNSVTTLSSLSDYCYHSPKYVIEPINIPVNLHISKGGENIIVTSTTPATVL